MPTTVDGMPPVPDWGPAPKTCVDAIEDEIMGWCIGREIDPFKLTAQEKWRLESVLAMWGTTNGR